LLLTSPAQKDFVASQKTQAIVFKCALFSRADCVGQFCNAEFTCANICFGLKRKLNGSSQAGGVFFCVKKKPS